jgi:hypothetical protein
MRKFFRTLLGTKTIRNARPKLSSRRTALGVETLETRNLMSVSPIDFMSVSPIDFPAGISSDVYTLEQGNLYRTPLSGTSALKSLIDTNVRSFALGSLGGTTYLFDLNSSGDLKATSGNGWVTQDTGVRSFGLGALGGTNYLFDLDYAGVLKGSSGSGWVTQDTGVVSFALDALGGTNYLFDLNSTGALKASNGSGWYTQDTGVVSFAFGSVGQTNYVIDLNSSGVLKASSGSGWYTQDTGVRSFAVGSLNGTNFLFDLDYAGVLKASSGSGWDTQDTDVQSFAMASLNGTNYVIDLTYTDVLKASSGSGWYTQDTGVRSFDVGSLNGINFLFDLDYAGVLKASSGSGWVTQDTGVQSFAFASLAGEDYVIDLTSTAVLKASSGSGWVTQDTGVGSFAVNSVGGTNYLCERTISGTVNYSNGTGWQTYSADAPGPFGTYQTPITNSALTWFGGADYTDIKQAGGNTCWIDASMAAMAINHENLALRIRYQGGHWYTVDLYNRDDPSHPTAGYHPETQWVYFDGTRTAADLAFDPRQPGESWQVIMQRAIIQAVAEWDPSQSITAPHSGGATDAQAILTGRWTQDQDIAANDANVKANVLGALAAGNNVVLHTRGNDQQGNPIPKTLVASHVYAVSTADDQYVWLYNPWGTLQKYSWDVIRQDGSVFCVN